MTFEFGNLGDNVLDLNMACSRCTIKERYVDQHCHSGLIWELDTITKTLKWLGNTEVVKGMPVETLPKDINELCAWIEPEYNRSFLGAIRRLVLTNVQTKTMVPLTMQQFEEPLWLACELTELCGGNIVMGVFTVAIPNKAKILDKQKLW